MRTLLAAAAILLGLASPATAADGPGVGTPTVVTLGDSAISGEGGRWAGNTNGSSSRTDALGSRAYWDTPATGEAIPGCHRSQSAQAHIGGAGSLNLACSGAKTTTGGTGSGQAFKPGIDFYSDSSGRQGQALALENYARTHNVRAVVLMIGANNYGFAAIVERCVTNWVTSPSWFKNYCSDDSDMTSRFTAARQATETANVAGAFTRVATAMSNAGYSRHAVQDHRPDLLVADPAQQRLPLPGDGLDAPGDRRLRHVEPRRELGQRHGRDRDEQQRQERRRRCRPHERRHARPRRLARRAAAVREQRRAARGDRHRHAGRAPARSTAASGSRRSGR